MVARDEPTSGLFEGFVDSTEGEAEGSVSSNVERLRGLVSAVR